jgi:hypothetical protein
MLSLNVADQQKVIRRATRFDPRTVPAVKQVLDTLDQGTPAEAYVRIGLLMSKAGGATRMSCLMSCNRISGSTRSSGDWWRN